MIVKVIMSANNDSQYDINGDKLVNVGDITELVNAIMNGE